MGKLSGYLFPTPDGLAVVYNPAHDRFRTRSTVAHEIAHVILEHEFDLLIGDDDGCKFGTGTQEEEANWFAGELLLPQGAARAAVFRGDTYESVSAQFDISIQMARWRMNISGAVQIMKRRSGARR
ncbi:ImmA/IrrE family metallo-endopeptidase [Lentzea sp. NBC_00516]|uniref:ImmA/IrrE family metallo-endopeptidase n=1 Tax=Lentzea sp. NBC_00516 TaxID=2903582 RepID=UPI002E80E8F0|nr:ImmA/IrrE family metallo-endopeptidase [Lentzea sp. NBC_00516]WUD22638.1 ImmA/IrrE family metallo-endopeptidase [Lentzea sp. NBC_00516]